MLNLIHGKVYAKFLGRKNITHSFAGLNGYVMVLFKNISAIYSPRPQEEVPVVLECMKYSSQILTPCFQISCCPDVPAVSINNSKRIFWSPTHHHCCQYSHHQCGCPYNAAIFHGYQQQNNSITQNRMKPQRIELLCHHIKYYYHLVTYFWSTWTNVALASNNYKFTI